MPRRTPPDHPLLEVPELIADIIESSLPEAIIDMPGIEEPQATTEPLPVCQDCGAANETVRVWHGVTFTRSATPRWPAPASQRFIRTDRSLCQTCIDNNHLEDCHRCADPIHYLSPCGLDDVQDDLAPGTDYTSNAWCPVCVESAAHPCSHCDEIYINSDYLICATCLSRTRICTECDERRDTSEFRGPSTTCNDCLDRDTYDDDEDEAEMFDVPAGRIFAYNTNPLHHLTFQGEPESGQPYYGVELEVSTARTNTTYAAQEVNAQLQGFAILKTDSSIGEGFEIVTAPATLAIHKERWTQFLTARHRLVHCARLQSWQAGTCGLHVHVSRATFGQTGHLTRFDRFYNNPSTRTLLAAIAGRTSAQWARVYDKPVSACGRHEWEYNSRYCAVNLQNPGTVEIRIFRGTLDLLHVLADIEFVDATVNFTRMAPLSEVEDGQTGLMNFLRDHQQPERYSNLINFLTRKGLYTPCAR